MARKSSAFAIVVLSLVVARSPGTQQPGVLACNGSTVQKWHDDHASLLQAGTSSIALSNLTAQLSALQSAVAQLTDKLARLEESATKPYYAPSYEKGHKTSCSKNKHCPTGFVCKVRYGGLQGMCKTDPCAGRFPSFEGPDFQETFYYRTSYDVSFNDPSIPSIITNVTPSPGQPYTLRFEDHQGPTVILRRTVPSDPDQKLMCVYEAPSSNTRRLSCVEAETLGLCAEQTCALRTYLYVITRIDPVNCRVLHVDFSGTKPLFNASEPQFPGVSVTDSILAFGNMSRNKSVL